MKKGFTLIELLAVIVILAIIALIAVPIVLNIRNSSRSSATVVSANFYVKGVNQAISKSNMNSNKLFVPKKCDIAENGDVDCDGQHFEIEVDGEKPKAGTLTYEDGILKSVYIEFKNRTIVMNAAKKLAVVDEMICTPVTEATTGNIPSGNFQPGDEYECEVKEGTKYNFFVLSNEENNINLILDRNICEAGTLVSTDGKCPVSWYAKDVGDSSYGPVAAMTYLHNATKNWDNIPNIIMNYEDEGNNGYGGITTTENITIILKKDGIQTLSLENLKARMPRNDELYNINCSDIEESCPQWIYNYLWSDNKEDDVTNIYAYWALSSVSNKNALSVRAEGNITTYGTGKSARAGVRPVISIPKTNIY